MTEQRSSELAVLLAEGVGRVACRGAATPVSRAAEQESFDLVEKRLVARRRRARGLRLTAALVGLCLLGAGGYWRTTRLREAADAPLTYRVGGGPSLQRAELLETSSRGGTTDVTFSDGTLIRMGPHMRGRVADVDRRGARITLYQGEAHVEVRHRQNARWLFQAGPFEVRVHGTAFSMAWDAASGHFDLHMESGIVSVTGPSSGDEIVLRAGETLSVGLDGKGDAGDRAKAPPTDLPGQAPPTQHDRRRTDGRRLAMVAVEPASPALNWRAALAGGHAEMIVADARRRGLRRVLDTVDSEDLAALADAARFLGSDGLARSALLAQRRRFPGSTRAAEAAFLLGRLEDESAGGGARALPWYDRYLAEASGGPYVSEALGRKVMDLERTGRGREAVAIASEYLRRFPAGSYAHAARALLGREDSSSPGLSPPDSPTRTGWSPSP